MAESERPGGGERSGGATRPAGRPSIAALVSAGWDGSRLPGGEGVWRTAGRGGSAGVRGLELTVRLHQASRLCTKEFVCVFTSIVGEVPVMKWSVVSDFWCALS